MVTGSRSLITLANLFALAILITTRPGMAEPISWMERYALAADREAILTELIPGSDDYYFYHCLHYQTAGQTERSEALLKDWLAEHKGRETAAITAMTDRQRLLTYHQAPQRTIDYLIRRLNIKLDHPPPATKNERRFPSQLDPEALSPIRLIRDALHRNDQLKPLGQQFLANRLSANNVADLSINLKGFLSRVTGPHVSGLEQLVIRELQARRANERRFGDLSAHQFLTLSELQVAAERVPEVADDDQLVQAILRRLRPGADEDASQQYEVRHDYLTRLETYLRTLPASYNSMKASATYRLLESNLQQGVFDADLFLRYLQLPRASSLVHRDWARRGGQRANLNDDFMDQALLPPIGDEEPLIRTHLEHFLRNAEDTEDYAQFLQPKYLRRVFAETKLLFGVGSEDAWYRMLTPAERQRIRDAVELRLAVDNPRQVATDEPTSLIVDVKNIEELVVRIYEINTPSYHRSHDKQIDTDIDLDGLIATHERTLRFNQPAVQRHREQLDLPEIDGRGVWVVDVVGKGVRARALVRRGAIDRVQSSDASGMVFTLIDQDRKPIPGATMWVGGREFVADEQGRIVLPPVADRVSRRAIISDGTIARQVKFQHLREQYRLSAGMHLDRTQLQSGGRAELLLRPRLMMGRVVIDPKTLKQVSLLIEATDLEGLPTSHKIQDLELNQAGELVVPIRVPARVAHLDVTLSAVIDGLSDAQEKALQTTQGWDIAEIRKTNHTHDAYLTRDADDFVIDVRGRNGELVAGATVMVSLTSNLRGAPVEQTLQADEAGRIRLGPLTGMTDIRYSVVGGVEHQCDLALDQVRWPSEIHAISGNDLQLPLASDDVDPAQKYRLLERRDGSHYADRTDRLSVAAGLLILQALPAGDYQLLDQESGIGTSIVVVDGPHVGQVAVGKIRHRSLSPARPLGIASLDRTDDGIRLKLSGDTGLARVHVYGSRYLDQSPLDHLYLPLPRLSGRRVSLPGNGYVSDLRLGDEYQYVLRRRYAQKYPGVMLPQPSVILNPWQTEETSNVSQMARAGEAPPPTAAADPFAETDSMMRKTDSKQTSFSSEFDFLADPGVVIANLRPDENGMINIGNDAIEGLPIVQLVVCDPATMLQRTLTAPAQPVDTIDMRLAKALDADRPLSFERGVMIAGPDNPLDLQSLGSAQLQVYSSVADLLKLYRTLVADDRLDEFEELGRWHLLDQAAKLDAYSRLASHELHLFLFFHDRSFFEEVVGPYLANKKEKQFVDHWLLGDELSSYTVLWRYNQLNAAERALLAMRHPEARQTVQRQLREIVATQDEDYDQLRRHLESALLGDRFLMESEVRGQVALHEDFAFDTPELSIATGQVSNLGGGLGGGAQSQRGRERLSRRRAEAEKLSEALADMEDADGAMDMFFGVRGMAAGALAFYRDLDTTKQWAESQWDRIRTVGGPAPSSLISDNLFWLDVAAAEFDGIGVSTHLLRPLENRHAALVAAALSGLPLSPGDVALPTERETPYRPSHEVAVVTKRLRRLAVSDDDSSVLIGQRFEAVNDHRSGQRGREMTPEPSEFLVGTAYRGQVVVSNPTAERRVVDVFWQLPAGCLPLAASQMTDSRTIALEPFAVEAIQYQFYFPADGAFIHYPATVGIDGNLVAQAAEKEFTVVDQPTQSDSVTWESVARSGSPAEMEAFLQDANLRDLDWMLVAHRMRDQDVYQTIMDVLHAAQLPIRELWAYSLVHRDEAAMRSYLSIQEDLAQRVGPVLTSALLEVEPIERGIHELLEYAPLVRARIHRLGEEDEILNPTFRQQYERFARVLGYSKEISADERLVLAYYLLIQNRIAKAIETFADIDQRAVTTQLQYDYMRAYLAMHRGEYDEAESVASNHSAEVVPRWRNRFTELLSQLRQRGDLNRTQQLVSVETKPQDVAVSQGSGDLAVLDRERRQSAASDLQPEVIVRVEGDELRIDHRRTKRATLNIYGVDLELLFSKAPFVREDLQRMAMVRPMRVESLEFDDATGVARYALKGDLRRQTLLVELVAEASRSTALCYGGDITTYVSESYGQLQTTDAETHQPISAAYVKVYARYAGGTVRFYKDGYTDARGRFDYTSLSASDAKGAERFAILVLSDEKGATLHDVGAPNQ